MTTYDSTFCTLTSVQNRWSIDGNQAADAVQLTKNIWDASASIAAFCQRTFVPFADIRLYDWTPYRGFILDTDALVITSVTDGSGVRASSDYVLYPYNTNPKNTIALVDFVASWTYTTQRQQAITITGTWGYNTNPARMWQQTTTLNGALNSSATTVTVTSASGLDVLQYIKVDDEMMQITAIAGAVLTVVRGVNGTTAAAHLTLAPVYGYQYVLAVREAAEEYAFYLYENRDKLGEDRVQILDGSILISEPSLKNVKTTLLRFVRNTGFAHV